MAPIISRLYLDKLIEARAYGQLDVFEAAVLFARAEGIIPAPEPAHAIKAVIDEARQAKAEGKKKVILFNLCGHGHFDMGAYDAYFAGKLENTEIPQEAVRQSLAELKTLPVPA
jgi:tryptophan synthase beta chain